MAKKDKRFVVLREDSVGIGRSVMILVDRVTGVHYLGSSWGYGGGGGLTPLLDERGQPVVDRGALERALD